MTPRVTSMIHVPDVRAMVAWYESIGFTALDVVEPHDTFYGMREFIIRDCNGFWITFGQGRELRHDY